MRSVATAAALALAALAAAGLTAGAGASGQSSQAGSQTFTDRVGDAVNGAPDISSVAVANDDLGNITMAVTLANHSSDFQPNEGILIVMDTDGSSGTGDGGFDYVYMGVKDHTGLFVWNGSSFVAASPATLQSSTAAGQISLRINRSDLGNATSLNFYVEATRDDADSIGDDAPDGSGVFSYRLVLPSAPPPPPSTTTTPSTTTSPPAPRFAVAPVGVPQAGKRFAVRARVLVGTRSVSPSALGCAAKIGSSPVKTTAVNGPAPYRSCAVTLPVRTTGKTLTVTLLVQYRSSGTTRRLSYRIR